MNEQRDIYLFISDDNKKFYQAKQQSNGDYLVSSSSQPYPLSHNPSNLLKVRMEFATNSSYFSLARSITYPLDFIKDGAAILRHFYFLRKGVETKVYLTVIQWNGSIYELSYSGRFDFSQKTEDPKAGVFTVSTVDDSSWGILSQNDSIDYSIECNNRNPKAVKVLFDGITLLNKYTYQTVQVAIMGNGSPSFLSAWQIMPFVLINQDGDSDGVISGSQGHFYLDSSNPVGDIQKSGSFFFSTIYPLPGFNIQGTIKFSSQIDSGQIIIYLASNLDATVVAWQRIVPQTNLINGKTYSFNFNITRDLQAGEKLFITAYLVGQYNGVASTITFVISNTLVSTRTKSQPQVAYGIRAGNFLDQLSNKATNGRYTVSSSFFNINNKYIVLSGDAIRGIPNAKIYSSFKDFFTTFDSIFYMALKDVNGNLFMELATNVYKQQLPEIIDLGECSDLKLVPAIEYIYNEVEVGSPKQDYRHPSGRLEFNSTNTFSLPILSENKKLSLITKYRLGCYDITFLLLDYRGGSSQDNNGDKSVYVVEITDEKGSAKEDIETFVNITIDNAILEPIIKLPLDNDVITYNKPNISGVAPIGSTVNIYVDSVLDGSTVTDGSGNWSYDIVTALSSYVIGITTGIHIIDATFGTEVDPKTTINLLINTSYTTNTQIIYPDNDSSLYNNIPLIRGVAQQGTVVNISLDGVVIGSVVANKSCKWSLQSTVIPNGNHVLSANGNDVSFFVDSNVYYPLVTYVGSELDGFPVLNNLPLIKGVAIPGVIVTLWLNYISYTPLGTATADANGNWSFQVVPRTYPDPLSGIPVVLSPMPNGLNIISTSLVNHVVEINVTGYKLNRPPFSPIIGVPDNTVFNTSFSPKRMLLNHSSLFASILNQQPSDRLHFQTADKNGEFSTTLGSVKISENTDVNVSDLGNPLFKLEKAEIKTKAFNSFAKTLYNFNNGGVIKVNYRGTDIFMLPIGSMSIENLTSDTQSWKLLLSPLTTYFSLLNLYKNGLTINIMKNSIYHSDYNSLHMVKYNFQDLPQYNFKEIYDDWFVNRNSAWVLNPEYIQKFQTTEVITDQLITNGVSNITLKVYRCIDAINIDSIPYVPVPTPPIPIPYVVMEAKIDLSLYPEDQYFYVIFVGATPVSISERIQTKNKWLGTILIESSNSINLVGAFFSTGFKSIIRVEGLVKKWQPDIETFIAIEENKDTELLYAVTSRKRTIRFGTAYGLPDYLYLKIADTLTMDNLFIEGNDYTLRPDEKISPSDDIDGHPLYYYNVNLDLRINKKGNIFATAPSVDTDAVVLVADATAFGLPSGSLINIELNNE